MGLKKPGQRGYKPRFNAKPAGQPGADMFAYDNALPCKNPKCKSHGKPHPSCKCYGSAKSMPQRRLEGLAHGGEVGRFCDTCQDHDPGCEYYAGGGMAGLEPVPPEDMPQSTAGFEPVPPEDMPAANENLEPVPPEDMPKDYGSTGQQAIAGLEGVAQGIAGPLATLGETQLLGVSPEDIAGRAAANPITHGVAEAAGLTGSMLTGYGEGALAAKIGGALAPEAIGKIGGSVLSGFITNGLIQGGDEISRGILGTGDPQAPVSAALAHMGAAGLFGGAIGGAGGIAAKGLGAIGEMKLGARAASFLAGVADGHAESVGQPIQKMTYGGQNSGVYKAGYDLVKQIPEHISDTAEGLGIYAGESVMPGFAGVYLGKAIGKMLEKPMNWAANKYAVPAVIRVLSSGEPAGLFDALDYAGNVGNGAQKMARGMTSLFQTGSQQIVNEATEQDKDKIKKYLSSGALNQEIQNQSAVDSQPQGYAEGGEVSAPATTAAVLQGTDAMSRHFPTQNILLQAAKGRVNNYLNGLRPQENQTRLPFDKQMKNAEADRKYEKAIAIAAQPLSVLNHVSAGTLTPETLGHFTQMYPEIHGEMSKHMTKKITELQAKDETIPYRLRQSMSLFLGSPLDSTLTPQAMQAAQATYSPQASQPASQQTAPPKKTKNSLSKIGEGDYTSSQAAAKRQASLRP